MKALCLFGVFAVAKLTALLGREISWSGWAPAIYFWQDAAMALLFAAALLLVRKRPIQWALYAAAVIYIGLNAVLIQVLSTPLTVPMLRAAR